MSNEPTPPVMPIFSGPSSFIEDLFKRADISLLLRPGQVLIEYTNTGAVVSGVNNKNEKMRDYMSVKTTPSGLDTVSASMELMRWLSKFMEWQQCDENYEISIGLSPTSDVHNEFMKDEIKDIVSDENRQKLYERGYVILKAFGGEK